MSRPSPPFVSVRASERLAGTPVVRRGAKWWLATTAGSLLVSDPDFTGELDRFAADMAVAERAVAELSLQLKARP
ncbi:hypothetical protein Sgleb_59960 [Streptomyces glebosus]|uniref:Uncharacterized protein n=1 Tax=Streptomyces glebosus TaxID=249580 RepID=A0A640T2M5_9ACTN|nr:hypothetical protein Sgleb_59960 [Streptomyces glebosus]GHG46928.1 hypothetical protein GCM10010513_03040 [Streptomyces glebosus]